MRRLLLSVTMCLCLFVPEVFAQSLPIPSPEIWRLKFTPYLWGPDYKGRDGIGEHSVEVDASFGDILKELNFGAMGTFEADADRLATLADFIYLNLSHEHATPGPLFSNADAISKALIVTPEAGYRIVGNDTAYMDILGGIRFWHVKGELKFEPGVLQRIEVSDTRDWVDGIFALRGKARLSSAWYLSGYGDIGGGGSNLTYQILGTAGADIGSRYALVFGYRYLNVDYDKKGFLFDNGMGGPIVGFTFKF